MKYNGTTFLLYKRLNTLYSTFTNELENRNTLFRSSAVVNKLEENCGKNQTEDHISATANKKSDYHELKRNIKLPHHTSSYNNNFQGF